MPDLPPKNEFEPTHQLKHKTDEELKAERNQSLQMDDLELAKLISLNKDEVLEIPNDKLLRLIQYTGIDAFVKLYGADHDYLERLYAKLGSDDPTSTNEMQHLPSSQTQPYLHNP